MKKIILILACISALACSCKKIVPLSEYPFDVTTKAVLYDQCVVDVMPENNDFYFQIALMSAKEVSMYGTAEALVKELDKRLHDEFNKYKELVPELDFKRLLYRGANERIYIDLIPDYEYVAIAYMYNEDMTPDPHPVKCNFKTYPESSSDINFQVTAYGSEVTIKPSNYDPYIITYESVKNLDESWQGSIGTFFMIAYFQALEYEMLPGSEVTGESHYDISDYYKMKAGDKYDFIMCGFDHGINSPYSAFRVTYNGEDQHGTVEKIELEPAEIESAQTDYVHKKTKANDCNRNNVRILGTK